MLDEYLVQRRRSPFRPGPSGGSARAASPSPRPTARRSGTSAGRTRSARSRPPGPGPAGGARRRSPASPPPAEPARPHRRCGSSRCFTARSSGSADGAGPNGRLAPSPPAQRPRPPAGPAAGASRRAPAPRGATASARWPEPSASPVIRTVCNPSGPREAVARRRRRRPRQTQARPRGAPVTRAGPGQGGRAGRVRAVPGCRLRPHAGTRDIIDALGVHPGRGRIRPAVAESRPDAGGGSLERHRQPAGRAGRPPPPVHRDRPRRRPSTPSRPWPPAAPWPPRPATRRPPRDRVQAEHYLGDDASDPSEPHTSFARSYPATFLITWPPVFGPRSRPPAPGSPRSPGRAARRSRSQRARTRRGDHAADGRPGVLRGGSNISR